MLKNFSENNLVLSPLIRTFAIMKLKFSIHYGTAWGESLHVLITYKGKDGTEKHQRHLMKTDDGSLWTLEVSAVDSRQKSIESFTYRYVLTDAEENIVREEWSLIPRTYLFDSTKDYVLDDQWRERPLNLHLYTRAWQTVSDCRVEGEFKPVGLPLFRQTIMFRVSAPQLMQGQSIGICGSHPAVGAWNSVRYLKMEYAGMGEWMTTVNMSAILLPLEYKYVIIDDSTNSLVQWEEGDNRRIEDSQPATMQQQWEASASNSQLSTVIVEYGEPLRVREKNFRAAGVSVPVSALRSEHSYGCGDFGDLKAFIDWAEATGMRIIQLLPVCDTTSTHRWTDANPYNITSAADLHPHYADLEEAGVLRDKKKMTAYHRQRQELNNLAYVDYEAVDRVKTAYLTDLYEEKYSDSTRKPSFHDFVQAILRRQLKAAADYARNKKIILKGDLPISISINAADVKQHPALFNIGQSLGTPDGENWHLPTYNWQEMAKDNYAWLRSRIADMEQYFDALRLDHVLGYFRVWEIPESAVDATLGHFSPSLPMTGGEIGYFGLPFRHDMLTQPFVNDRLLDKLFGMHAQYVRDNFLEQKAYQLYALKPQYDTQQKVCKHFEGRHDENSIWIRDGLYRLIGNVLFVDDPYQEDMYHPRFGALTLPVFEALNSEDKDAYMRIYNHYFYQRHNLFWGNRAMKLLPAILANTRMLVCAEDLGMLPDCVAPVLDHLRIPTLEVQTMPKHSGFEFAHLDANPMRSVATISTHDMPSLRLWWEENPDRTQRYYVTMLQKEGRAPQHLPAHLAEEIIARNLYSPSMFCILSIQDWLSMNSELRQTSVRDERVNNPSDPYSRWQYRMNITIEKLTDSKQFNSKLHTLISRSRRLL